MQHFKFNPIFETHLLPYSYSYMTVIYI